MFKFLFFLIATCITFQSQAQENPNKTDTSPADSILLKQLEQQMLEPTPSTSPSTTQARTSPTLNPKISVIGDFESEWRSKAKRNLSTYLKEMEFSFQAAVDPYARADVFFSVEKDRVTGEFHGSIEEAYLTSLSLPFQLQLKVGRFKNALGKINIVHSHAQPFITAPVAYEKFFGDGLDDEGVSLSWLIPNPAFYQEIVMELTDGPTDSPIFARSSSNNLLKLVHLKNFWDLSANSTLEFGLTGVLGANSNNLNTKVGAFDLTYKWKPIQFNTYKSITSQTEWFFTGIDQPTAAEAINSWGMYSLFSYQFARRWFGTARYDFSKDPYLPSDKIKAYTAMVGWFATEFQKIEFESQLDDPTLGSSYVQVLLRWIFVIGSHGAHKY